MSCNSYHTLKFALNNIFKLVACALLLTHFSGCSPQKDTIAGRGMQNLTARYNILYNGRELLKESQQNIELAYQDNYDVLISVFKEPTEALSQSELKKLDDVILKANAIINDKSQSKYVDDAYLLIAKANFLKSNFFNATEFFTYIYNTYPKQPELRQLALVYKARSLMNSDRFEEAKLTLDTAFKHLDTEKESVAELYAASAQLAIYGKQDAESISLLEKAISHSKKDDNKVRWIFLLAQLQELTGKKESAVENYSRVIKSNAPFDMAFNAILNRLSIRDELNGQTEDRAKQLLSLLKDDNNLDFADQVYFKIGNLYQSKGELDQAIGSYNTSIQKSTRNENQKGLSYLALADLYFKQADYVRSNAYYDSTLASLSPQYPDYELIRKKANSLELLANRLSLIAREDTLQMLAKLPEAERKERIGVLVRSQAQKVLSSDANLNINQGSFGIRQPSLQNSGSEKFYFNNPIALSQGLSDFKRIWGNRKLEDNWRRGQRSSSDLANANNSNSEFVVPANPDEAKVEHQDMGLEMANTIPTTHELLAASNERILSAYYDIANYYRDVLMDEAEAIRVYELMLSRFPDNNLKLPVYYNLFRLYANRDPKKSVDFKNILLTQYAESPFAKVIKNPSYSDQNNEQEAALHLFYNQVYENYTQKNYREVLKLTSEARQSFADNKLSAQLAYLRALALGHTENVTVLENAFKEIVVKYPEEKLVTPLVQQHLQYITLNKGEMTKRTYALVDFDQNEPRFVEEPQLETAILNNDVQPVASKPVKTEATDKPVTQEEKTVQPTSPTSPAEVNSLFTLADSEEYYFIVNVTDPSVNLSSSRFGIGQFNRVNYSGDGIKHQLKSVNNQNQLIFVGVFTSKSAVDEYYRNINPLMKDIMKVPSDKFVTFYISKQNLDKLNDRDTINKYIEFYQQNFSRSE